MRRLAVFVVLVASACAARPAPPLTPQVRLGPAASKVRAARVLVLPASCGSMERACRAEYTTAVDTIVRSTLEFSGYGIVPAETLLDQTRARNETQTASEEETASHSTGDRTGPFILREHVEGQSSTRRAGTSSVVVLDGPIFEDLDVARRRAVIAESGAQAVVSVRVVVGGMQSDGWNDRDQQVEVMVKLGDGDGDTLAWAARCRANATSYGGSTTRAIEEAARCAVRGGTGE